MICFWSVKILLEYRLITDEVEDLKVMLFCAYTLGYFNHVFVFGS